MNTLTHNRSNVSMPLKKKKLASLNWCMGVYHQDSCKFSGFFERFQEKKCLENKVKFSPNMRSFKRETKMGARCFREHQSPVLCCCPELTMSLLHRCLHWAIAGSSVKRILSGNQKPVSLTQESTVNTLHRTERPVGPLDQRIPVCPCSHLLSSEAATVFKVL